MTEKGKSKPEGLTAATSSIPKSVTARNVAEVYRKAQVVIYLISPYDKASLEYVRDSIGTVPYDLDVLISFGFKDLVEETAGAPDTNGSALQEVTLQAVHNLVNEARANGGRQITVIESSNYSGYGLRDLYKFLYLPFIRLQQKALFSKIQFLDKERARTCDEIENDNGSVAKYQEYMQAFEKKLQTAAGPALSRSPTPPSARVQSPASSYVRDDAVMVDQAGIAMPSTEVEEVKDSSSVDISEDEEEEERKRERKRKRRGRGRKKMVTRTMTL